MTYTEVIICLLIVTILIGPIATTFVSATRIRASAEAISESTTYAEEVMEKIKEQLTKDIAIQKKKEGNEVVLSTEQETKLKMLFEDTPNTSSEITLKDFLEEPIGSTVVDTLYETSRYSYEVALWSMKNSGFSDTEPINLESSSLDKAIRLYTDTSYKVNGTSIGAELKEAIKLSVDEVNAKIFNDSSLYFIPSLIVTDSIKEITTITLPSNLSNSTEVEAGIKHKNGGSDVKTELESKVSFTEFGVLKIGGYNFKIEANPLGAGIAATDTYIIYLDIRQLIRTVGIASVSESTTYDGTVFKFINNTPAKVIIKVVRSEAVGVDNLEDIDKKYSIVVENTSVGQVTIERVETSRQYENFIVGLIVRDKKPSLGKPGKVIKVMLDVYSYEQE